MAGASFTAKLARAIPALLLWAGSDNNPATYFLFNRSNNHLSTLPVGAHGGLAARDEWSLDWPP